MDVNKQGQLVKNLSTKIWDMADSLRGSIEAYEFKSYILGIIFYKFLSDKAEKQMEEILKEDGISYKEAWEDVTLKDALIAESLDKLGYVVEPKYFISNMLSMIHAGTFSIDYLEDAIASITNYTKGQKSESTFDGLFEDMNLQASKLGSAVAERTKAIADMIKNIDEFEVDFDSTDVDILGAAYEDLIGRFASTAGKKGGEFYTPTNMSKLVARLATLGLTRVKNVFDPTCGSGSLLLQVGRYVDVSNYYGQEYAHTTYNLARQNMLLHGVDYDNFKIVNCNTLTEDIVLKDIKYTVQVANPPYSLKYNQNDVSLSDPRYAPYGKLAPNNYADLMFVEHMIHHMDDNGRIAVLLPHGVLFRSGAEGLIRKFMVANQNYLDAVIGLPENCFHGTNISVACLIFKKNRGENEDNICFIDASKYFTKVGNKNTITDTDINRIVNAYTERKDIDKFCYVATMEEIKENDYNLNISRYVDNFEAEELVDIDKTKEELSAISQRKQAAIDRVNATMKLLGL